MIIKIIGTIAILGLTVYLIPITSEYGKQVFEILTSKDLGLEEYEEDIDE
jgi:hypothetical protein